MSVLQNVYYFVHVFLICVNGAVLYHSVFNFFEPSIVFLRSVHVAICTSEACV